MSVSIWPICYTAQSGSNIRCLAVILAKPFLRASTLLLRTRASKQTQAVLLHSVILLPMKKIIQGPLEVDDGACFLPVDDFGLFAPHSIFPNRLEDL